MAALKWTPAGMSPPRTATAAHLGDAVDPTNIGLKFVKLLHADGAAFAKKWARLMAEVKREELNAQYAGVRPSGSYRYT